MADLTLLAWKHGIPAGSLFAFAEANADYFRLDPRDKLALLQGEWPGNRVDDLLSAWFIASPTARARMSPRSARMDADRPVIPVDFEVVARESREAAARANQALRAKAEAEREALSASRREAEDEIERRVRADEEREARRLLEGARARRRKAEDEERRLEAALGRLHDAARPRPAPSPTTSEDRLFDLSM